MWSIKYLKTNRRQFRRNIRVLIRLVLISILVWFILIISYTIFNKLEKILKSRINDLYDPNYNIENSGLDELKLLESYIINRHKFSKQGLVLNLKQNDYQLAKIIDTKSLDFFKKIQRRSYDINCQNIIEWEENEVRKAKRILFKLKSLNNHHFSKLVDVQNSGLISTLPDSNYIFDNTMCDLFKDLRGYYLHKITDFELKFPIAFTILTYNNVEQFERLLRIIYRPHNVYCIHVDSKSPRKFHEAIKSITDCFSNVFISTKLERIVYAGFNRLKADINCMHDLVNPDYMHPNLVNKNLTSNWKYLLNMASTEFPLRTNYELAKILQMFNGANDIEVMTNFQKERIQYSWKVKRKQNNSEEYMVRTKRLKTSVPHNYTVVKGLAYCSFSRKFVEYTLTNVYAKNLLKWSQDTYSPDEWYWATLNYNIQFNPPGGFRHPNRTAIPTKSRYIGWKNSYKCMGELRHNICVFSLEDLPELVTRNEFFLNKFLIQFDPIAYQCMEEWINSRISLYQTVNIINYCRLLFVLPYSINPSCARLIENKNYQKKNLNNQKKHR